MLTSGKLQQNKLTTLVNNTLMNNIRSRMVELFKWLNKIKRILISTAPKQNLESVPEKNKTSISTNLQENLVKIQDVFANASDLVIRQFKSAPECA